QAVLALHLRGSIMVGFPQGRTASNRRVHQNKNRVSRADLMQWHEAASLSCHCSKFAAVDFQLATYRIRRTSSSDRVPLARQHHGRLLARTHCVNSASSSKQEPSTLRRFDAVARSRVTSVPLLEVCRC